MNWSCWLLVAMHWAAGQLMHKFYSAEVAARSLDYSVDNRSVPRC